MSKATKAGSGNYQPFRDLRFYPGANLDESRQKELANLGVEADELTSADIAWHLGMLWTRVMYMMLAVVRDRHGEQEANAAAEQFGYQVAKSNLTKWMQARNLKRMTPEQFARFQDNRHALGGAKAAESFISYDDDGVYLHRTGCGYHDNRPDGHPSFCRYSAPGFFRGYAEVDPQIRGEVLRCRSRGDSKDDCKLQFKFLKD